MCSGLIGLFPHLGAAVELVAVEGAVYVQTATGAYRVHAPHQPLAAGDRVLVPAGSRAQVRYADCLWPLPADSIHRVDPRFCTSQVGPFQPAAATLTSDTAALSGSVWNDLNDNRLRDQKDPPLSGVSVTLVGHGCRVGIDCPMTTSDSQGNFGFLALTPGSYQIGTTNEKGEFKLVGTLVLKAGITTKVSLALTSAGFVLLGESAAVVAGGAVGGGSASGGATTGAASGAGAASGMATTGAASGVGAASGMATTGAAALTATTLVPAAVLVTAGTVAISNSGSSSNYAPTPSPR